MKKEFIILIVFIIVVGLLLFFLLKNKGEVHDDMKINDIEYFSMNYTKGYMINSDIRYKVEYDKENNEYYVYVKPYGKEEEIKVISPDGFRDKIKDILIKYHVEKWNGFKKYAKDVLDGDSFSFYVKMKDGNKIEANGYMMWPDNYRDVVREIDSLFMDVYNNKKNDF